MTSQLPRPSPSVGATDRSAISLAKVTQQRVALWMRACKEGTIECVSAVKEVLRRMATIIVSMLSLSGKEQGPREEL